MNTMYLIVFTLLGGALALFGAAGWGSYSQKKVPETSMLFRWFVAGGLGSGLASYAWLFGANGDPSKMIDSLGEAFEVKDIMKTLTSAVDSGSEALRSGAVDIVVEGAQELQIGMPNF